MDKLTKELKVIDLRFHSDMMRIYKKAMISFGLMGGLFCFFIGLNIVLGHKFLGYLWSFYVGVILGLFSSYTRKHYYHKRLNWKVFRELYDEI